MLEMAKCTAHDVVIDLGSGDGRVVITAAKRGARAMGVEYDPSLVEPPAKCRRRGRQRPGLVRSARSVPDRLAQATVISTVPARRPESQAVPSLGQAGHARRLQYLRQDDWEPDDPSS